METAKYLLSRVIFLIPIIIVFAILYKMGTMLVPFLPKTFSSVFGEGDILPPPGSLSLLGQNGKKIEPTLHTDDKNNYFVYQNGTPNFNNQTNGAGANNGGYMYISYDKNGKAIYTDVNGNVLNSNGTIKSSSGNQTNAGNVAYERSSYVRNLSIFEYGHIYTGLRFVGEAKGTMFNNGVFPIFIIDNSGRILAQEQAVAQERWAVPGWVRFEVKVNSVLPVNIPCRFVFQAAPGSTDGYKKVFVTFSETCN